MKRTTLFGLIAAAAVAPLFASAQASTSTDIYDQAPWANDAMLELFAKAADEGRAYPTQAEFEAAGVTFDLEYFRSHTAKAPLIDAGHIVTDNANFNANRRLWMNIPGGFGSNTGGYPSTRFNNDVYSMWNYTHLFGSWNYGFLQAPGSWIDAAHKNGTRIYSGIKFFESWTAGSESAGFAKFITTKNPDGSYRYVDAIINACAFFGGDGLNYNMEDSSYQDADWIEFHRQVKVRAKERGLSDFGIGMYTANQSLTAQNVGRLYGNSTDGPIYDCFLNYSDGNFNTRGVASSLSAAKSAVGTAEDVYQGVWIVTMDRDWTGMNAAGTKEMNLVLWGEHDQSRFFQYTVGTSLMNIQENYQILLERSFSGGNRNPLNRPTLANSGNNFQVTYENVGTQMTKVGGLATMIPERSAIGGNLPFNTYFNLGNGDSYFYKGKIAYGAWYNMGSQDIVPTYRWLVTPKGDMTKASSDNLDVRFVHEDSYIGGSSIRLSGKTSGADLILYRTNLKVSNGSVKAALAMKGAAGATNTSLIVRKAGSTSWIEVPFGDLKGTSWEQKELAVSGLSEGDVVEYIGLRVNSSDENFKLYVGQVGLYDNTTTTPASIKPGSVNIEIKEETPISLSVKLNWEPNYSADKLSDFGMVYNKDLNIDHYEIVYKEGVDGKVKAIGTTSQWATYIGKIPMDQTVEAYIGVRSVSTDLKTVSGVEWVAVPRYTGELPEVLDNTLYGETYLFNVGNSNKASIQSTIYWEDIKTTGATKDLNYHMDANPVTDSTQYYYAQDHVLEIAQGQEISLFFKGFEAGSDCLKYDWVKAYIDYDGNYNFLDADEELFTAGTLNSGTPEISTPGMTFKFKVPEDAVTGNSRLRMVASDAWGAHPGPLGGTWKGYSIDFPVVITGSNAERQPAPTYKDTADQGDVEEPEGLFSGVQEIGAEAGISSVSVVDNVAYFTNTDKAWFYDMNARCVKFVSSVQGSVNVADLAAGVYVVKMQNGHVIRSAKVVVK